MHKHRWMKVDQASQTGGFGLCCVKHRCVRIFFGQTFDLEFFAWINFVWIIENK